MPWENEEAPPALAEALRPARRVWTCSAFCARALGRHLPGVDLLPHVVRRPRLRREDLDWARALLSRGEGEGAGTLFLSVLDGLNPRKNLPALLAAFGRARRESGAPMRLLLKQYRAALPIDLPGVINFTEMLEAGRMAALYALCDAYVSPHRAEGWGLGLSTAMSFGKITVAPAYSGNLEFMHPRNSILLPCALVPVGEAMERRMPAFRREMRWADVNMDALTLALRRVAEGRADSSLGREAARITETFSRERGAEIMRGLLDKL
jgi:glycosyltransferase involved in cell wall biosynthesis